MQIELVPSAGLGKSYFRRQKVDTATSDVKYRLASALVEMYTHQVPRRMGRGVERSCVSELSFRAQQRSGLGPLRRRRVGERCLGGRAGRFGRCLRGGGDLIRGQHEFNPPWRYDGKHY